MKDNRTWSIQIKATYGTENIDYSVSANSQKEVDFYVSEARKEHEAKLMQLAGLKSLKELSFAVCDPWLSNCFGSAMLGYEARKRIEREKKKLDVKSFDKGRLSISINPC